MAWGGPDTARVIAPPPLMYLLVWLLCVAADRFLGLPRLGLSDAPRYGSAAALFAGGAGLALWGLALFKRAGTDIVPNRPTTALVTSGPYRWSRNPNYVAQTLLYAGGAVLANSLSALLALLPLLVVINVAVVRREERYLESLFGAEYRAYKTRVRRWV